MEAKASLFFAAGKKQNIVSPLPPLHKPEDHLPGFSGCLRDFEDHLDGFEEHLHWF